MGQPRAVIVPFVINKNLGFVFEAAESGRVNDTVAIPLKPGSVRVFLFGMVSFPAFTAFNGIGGEAGLFQFFEVLPFDQDFGSKN